MSRTTLIIVTAWLIFGGFVYYLVDGIENPNKLSNIGEGKTVVLKRGLNGHYSTEGLD